VPDLGAGGLAILSGSDDNADYINIQNDSTIEEKNNLTVTTKH